MNIGTGLQQQLSQTLSPQLLQAIEFLQLSTLDLLARIDTELGANSALERRDVPVEADSTASERAKESRFDGEVFAQRDGEGGGGSDAKSEALANAPARDGGSLRQHLESQLSWVECAGDLRSALATALSAIDDRGLLPLDDDGLASLVGGAELAAAARGVLRTLEPRGVGARDSLEAMLWQLDPDDPDLPAIDDLLRHHLAALANKKLETVARGLGMPLAELERLLGRVRGLDPRPGSDYVVAGSGAAASPVRVELRVERCADGSDFQVVVDDQFMPLLGINREVAELSKDPSVHRAERQVLADQVRSARELMTAVEMRQDTLLRVGAAVMRHQRAFLERGVSEFRALNMSTIAEEIGVHTSTVSRAVAGKHVQTEHGVFALRDFFDGSERSDIAAAAAKPGDDAADAKGRKAIVFAIERLIADEDPRKPLSDDELVARLADREIRIARRTVAKYRNELGIRSSWQRRSQTP